MQRLLLTALALSLAVVPATVPPAGAAPPAGATTIKRFKVASLEDAGLAGGGTSCVSTLPDGKCTLRAAVQAANNLTPADAPAVAIALKPGTIRLTQGELGFKNTTLAIAVTGPAADRAIIDGGGNSRVIDVCDGARVSLAGLTVRNGRATVSTCANTHTHGAGIHNHGVLTVTGVRVLDNYALTGLKGGGGITNAGSGELTLRNSVVARNEADRGGGIENFGTLHIHGSTISTNIAYLAGGGIWNNSANTLLLRHVTVTNNTVGTLGSEPSGGLENFGGAVYAGNTIIANNRRSFAERAVYNCGGKGFMESGGGNLENTDVNFGCFGPADVRTPSLFLGPLRINPGKHRTETHALLAGSPAIDAGNNAECAEDRRDQRGVKRKDRPRVGAPGVVCDIGAYEYP